MSDMGVDRVSDVCFIYYLDGMVGIRIDDATELIRLLCNEIDSYETETRR